MRWLAIVVALVALAACSGSHGHGPDAGGDGDGSAASFSFTGHATVRQLANDPAHLPAVIEGPFQTLAITAHLDDGTSMPITPAADGSFTLTTPAPIARLEVANDVNATTDYELGAPMLDLAVRQGSRYDRVVPAPSTALAFTITSAASGNVRIVSTGVWTQSPKLPSASTTFNFDWSTAPGLLDAAANDRVYYTVETSVGSTQYLALTSMCSADVTMVQGMTTPVACTAAPVTQDQCTHIVAHVVDEATRVAAAAGPAFTTIAWDWTVAALPAETFGAISPIVVAHSNATTEPSADVDRMVTYAQPFPGHSTTVAMTYARTRSYAMGQLMPMQLRVATTHWVKPAADCTTPAELTGTVALATTPVLDGVTLDSDGLALAFDAAHPHVVSWGIASGAADHWLVRVEHVIDNAGTTDTEVTHSYLTAGTSITLDPAIFTPGQHYLINIQGAQFFPGAAAGDLRTIGYPAAPYATSEVTSGVFVVDNG